MIAGITAIQVPAAANAAAPAQAIDENASAKVATRDEVWRRRNWLRFAWARKQSWMAVADPAAAAIPSAATRAMERSTSASGSMKGENTSAMHPIIASILARTT